MSDCIGFFSLLSVVSVLVGCNIVFRLPVVMLLNEMKKIMRYVISVEQDGIYLVFFVKYV